jgi:hypothetical protein
MKFKFTNARQPLALALPLKSNEDSARPVSSLDTSLHQVAHEENGSMSVCGGAKFLRTSSA